MTLKPTPNNPMPYSDVQPYPLLEELPTKAQHGVLGRLVPPNQAKGTWVNIPTPEGPRGLHTTIMPTPGSSSEQVFGAFHFKSQKYTEVLNFEKLDEPVRNRGGTNEQFNGVVKYDTVIKDLSGAVQHVENGMYLWLGENNPPKPNYPGNMYRHPSTAESVQEDDAFPVMHPGMQGPQFIPPYSISRGGVIPHGSTIHIMGTFQKDVHGAPTISPLWDAPSLAVSDTMGFNINQDVISGSREMPPWTQLRVPHHGEQVGKPGFLDQNSGRAYIHRIFVYNQFGAAFPYTVQPNLLLTDANEGLNILDHDIITLDTLHATGHQGGIINNVMINRYCKVTRMSLRMWIERVDLCDGLEPVDQLQYEQIVDFEFMFGSNGGTTRWPHIQVNTLRRLEDVQAGRY